MGRLLEARRAQRPKIENLQHLIDALHVIFQDNTVVALLLCCYVVMLLCCHVAMLLCYYVAMLPCCHVAMLLCCYVVML